MLETSQALRTLYSLTVGFSDAQLALRGLREQRDNLIREAYIDGENQSALAKVTGLTRQRIQQICGKDEER